MVYDSESQSDSCVQSRTVERKTEGLEKRSLNCRVSGIESRKKTVGSAAHIYQFAPLKCHLSHTDLDVRYDPDD